MIEPATERDERLAVLIDELRLALRSEGPSALARWQAAHQEFGQDIAELASLTAALDQAIADWDTASRFVETHFSGALEPTPDPLTTCLPSDSSQVVAAPAEMLSDQVGRYVLRRVLGSGGMGTVFEGFDSSLDRSVAIKVPHVSGLASDRQSWVRRFLREACAAAQIRHPHVCPIYDVGEHEGLPFIVMAYVEGANLAHRLNQGALNPSEVVRLGRQVAEALVAIHRAGIVHRDLKPANILLDKHGNVLLADFGLARPNSLGPTLTAEGALVGTPAYMSPEQVQSETEKLDQRSDLFSLGCVLYQAATGVMPFTGLNRSQVLFAVVYQEPAPIQQLNPTVPEALVKLISRLLAKTPAERPQSAEQVVAELDRIGALVPGQGGSEAEPPASRRANPGRLFALLGLFVALAVLLGGVGVLVNGTMRRTGTTSETSQARAPAPEHPATHPAPKTPARVGEGKQPGATVPSALDMLDRRKIPLGELAEAGRGDPARAPKELVAVVGDSRWRHWGDVRGVSYVTQDRLITYGNERLVRIWDRTTGRTVQRILPSGIARVVAAHPPSGKDVFTGGLAGVPQRWPIHTTQGPHGATSRTKEWVRDLLTLGNPAIIALVCSRDGDRVATAQGREIIIRDANSLNPQMRLGAHTADVFALAFSPDGRRLAAGTANGTYDFPGAAQEIIVWDLESQSAAFSLPQAQGVGLAVAWSGDGQRIAASGHDGSLRIWDAQSQRLVFSTRGHMQGIRALAFSPDSQHLATGSFDESVHIHAAHDGRLELTIEDGLGPVEGLAYSPDGAELAVASKHAPLLLFTAGTGKPVRDGPVLSGSGEGLALLPDGSGFVVGGFTPQIWKASQGAPELARTLQRSERGHKALPRDLIVSGDGKQLITVAEDGRGIIWDLDSGSPIRDFELHTKELLRVALRADGKQVATAGTDRRLKVWNLADANEVWEAGVPETVYALAYGRDGELFAGCIDGSLFGYGRDRSPLWPRKMAHVGSENGGTLGGIHALAVSPDGQVLASSGFYDGRIKLWRPQSGELLDTLSASTIVNDRVLRLAFSPDGRVLAAATVEGRIWFWDFDDAGKATRRPDYLTLGAHDSTILSILFAPDSRHLLTANSNGTVYVFRLEAERAPAPRDAGNSPPP